MAHTPEAASATARALLIGLHPEVPMVVRAIAQERITIRVDTRDSSRQQRELRAFVHYCVERLEKQLGVQDAWIVHITPSLRGVASHVAVRRRGGVVEASGTGGDGTLATWHAMCGVEQKLRESR